MRLGSLLGARPFLLAKTKPPPESLAPGYTPPRIRAYSLVVKFNAPGRGSSASPAFICPYRFGGANLRALGKCGRKQAEDNEKGGGR